MRSSEKSVNSRQLDGQRYVGVEAMKRRPCRLRETCVAVGQRVSIVDELNSAGEPLHSHFLIFFVLFLLAAAEKNSDKQTTFTKKVIGAP